MRSTTEMQHSEKPRVIWVTGAKSPIGQAICGAWAQRAGVIVIATDTDAGPSGPGIIGMACDITSRTAIDSVIAECRAQGGIDVLINATDTVSAISALEIEPHEWDQTFDINVRGPFLCSQAAAREMSDTGTRGTILLIGSSYARKVGADTVAYSTSKGAIHALGRSMALALRPQGIRVNIIAPRMEHTALARPPGTETQAASADDRHPDAGICTSVAHAALFLASPEADSISGTTLFVDNGQMASV